MPPKGAPVAEADPDDINEDVDDDGTNAEPKKAAARARAISGDAKNASGRSLAERAGKARVREALTEDMNDGNQNPTPNSNYDRFYTDPVTGRVYMIDAEGNLLGDELVNDYDAPGSPLTMGETGPADMLREQIADNNADAGQVEPEAAEQGRAVKKSGKVERLEVEQKEAAGDTRGAKEARSRRFKIIASILGTTAILAVLAIVVVPTTLHLTGNLPGTGPAVKSAVQDSPDPTKTVVLDVPALILVTPNDPSAITSSVKLSAPDAGNPLRFTIANVGYFELAVDQTNTRTGKLSFVPQTGYKGGAVVVTVTIDDTKGNSSKDATITLNFPVTTPGTPTVAAKPQVKSAQQNGLDPSKNQLLDVPALILVTPNDPTADKTSVQFNKPDMKGPLRLSVPNSGHFELEVDAKGVQTGKMTFYPLTHFLGGAVQAGVKIASTSKVVSDLAIITLNFDTRAKAGDLYIQGDLTQVNTITFNPITAKGVDMGMAAVKGSYDIDPKTVFLSMPVPMEGGEPQQGKITVTGGRKAVAVGEGTWTVNETTGDITFVRDPGFQGNPTPLAWSVFDTNKIPSTVGTMTISSYISGVVKTIQSLNTMDDAAFWLNYENTLVKADFGALDKSKDIVGILTLYRTVHSIILNITRASMSTADADTVTNARPTQATVDTAFKAWAAAGLNRTTLYQQGKTLTPTPNPAVDSIKNGARLRLLSNITRLLGEWQNAMDRVPPPGGN